MSLRNDMYIAVHGGAGMHSYTRAKEIKHALRSACKEVLKAYSSESTLSVSQTPLDTVGNAIAILENDPHLNAGYGSNLTLEGTVECDAAVMDGHSDFGSVGAVSGIKNPIRLARAILDHSKIPDPLGRIPPLTLVSDGARSFAAAKCASLEIVTPESMISPKAKDDWMKWKARLDGAASSLADTTAMSTDSGFVNFTDIQDTVGAVAYGNGDTIAAGVSRHKFFVDHWKQDHTSLSQQYPCKVEGRTHAYPLNPLTLPIDPLCGKPLGVAAPEPFAFEPGVEAAGRA
ncbi:hypothetical protein C0991_011368 [Blastosporella zonata]|nr:hypothetical protein C0991_011368 [Blastosporella zonata]